jgi:hypothetical protein
MAVSVILEPFDSGIFSHESGSAYAYLTDWSQAIFPPFIGYPVQRLARSVG